MKKTWMVVGALMILVACAAPTVTDKADEPQADQPAQNQGGEEKTAGVGDSITLAGNEEGLTMKVTVIEVQDPAKSVEQYAQPPKGDRFVAVRVELKNVGKIVYADAPSNSATIVDHSGQGHNATFATLRDEFPPNLRIQPGSRQVGSIAFEVPKKSKLDIFQFTLESGFGPETGEWKL